MVRSCSVRLRVAAQNSGQGLGFVVGGTVIDRKSLKLAAVKLASGVTTAITTLFALTDGGSGAMAGGTAAGQEQCGLSNIQASTIRSLLAGRNTSCSYGNVTLGAILGA